MPPLYMIRASTQIYMLGTICNNVDMLIYGTLQLESSGRSCNNTSGRYQFTRGIVYSGGKIDTTAQASQINATYDVLCVHSGASVSANFGFKNSVDVSGNTFYLLLLQTEN